MRNIIRLLKLHIKTQWLLYFFPVIFLYCLIMFYHTQLLAGIVDEDTMRKVMDSAQKTLLLFGIWYQYLGFRMILSPELREVSYGVRMRSKGWWCISSIVVFFITVCPYMIWLAFQLGSYGKNVGIIVFQCVIIEMFTFFLMHVCQSALAGLAAATAYYFLNVNHLLPPYLSVAMTGILPNYYPIEWYALQVSFAVVFFTVAILLKK